jgi:hypothetical protein
MLQAGSSHQSSMVMGCFMPWVVGVKRLKLGKAISNVALHFSAIPSLQNPVCKFKIKQNIGYPVVNIVSCGVNMIDEYVVWDRVKELH